MYNNYEDSETDIKGKILSALKNEYSTDILKANKKKNQQNEILTNSLGFADITVWFYNKNCEYALEEAKQIWDLLQTNPFDKHTILDFLNMYTDQLLDKHRKYMLYHGKYKKLEKIVTRTYEIIESLEDFLSDIKSSVPINFHSSYNDIHLSKYNVRETICFSLVLDSIEGHDLAALFQDPNFIGHHIEFGYKDDIVCSPVEMTSGNKIDFKLNRVELNFRLKDGSIFINLYEDYVKNGQQYKNCVATRNLDLFTNVNHKFLNDLVAVNHESNRDIAHDSIQTDVYYLKKIVKKKSNVGSNCDTDQYVKLNMSIQITNLNSCDGLIFFKNVCFSRKQYLEIKMKNIKTKSSLYKKKLSLLINPFSGSLSFNEKTLCPTGYNSKINKGHNGCNIF